MVFIRVSTLKKLKELMGVQYCNSNQPTLGLNKTNIVKLDFNIIKVI